jgi:hypothetical protein
VNRDAAAAVTAATGWSDAVKVVVEVLVVSRWVCRLWVLEPRAEGACANSQSTAHPWMVQRRATRGQYLQTPGGFATEGCMWQALGLVQVLQASLA